MNKRISILFYIAALGFLIPIASADSRIGVTARIVGFRVDPFFATELGILDEEGNSSGSTTFHEPCAIAEFELIEPLNEQGKALVINFTDGRFLKGRKRKMIENGVEEGSIFTFRIPADYFESEHDSISGNFVEKFKISRVKPVDTKQTRVPQ